jgi:sigma-B regulation protein RsbU (phosphoserine phosphatase)
VRDKIYLITFLLMAALLIFLGHDLLQRSVLFTWVLTFGGTSVVSILTLLLYRLRLQLQASRRELARKDAELSFALEVQKALFPRQLPVGDGLEFSAVCIPARGISGDYYDVIKFPDGRLVFTIADISGKGISAAILMANLQALLRALAAAGYSPAEVCKRLNQHLHQVTDAARFATSFYAEWHAEQRQLTYVNAGHNPPILLGSCQGQQLVQGGTPLGMFPGAEFQVGNLSLQPDDLLVLYSDGITEAASRDGEEFSEARLESLVRQHSGEPLVKIQSHILQTVRGWAGNELEDDMTLMLVRATGRH